MTLSRITLAAACLGAMALSAVQLRSLWRTGQPLFGGRRTRVNPAFAFALDMASNTLVLVASAALLVWALAG
jgi:hypothetical protein